MIFGINAFNIRAGGGVTHLVELLRAADPHQYGFNRVIVWATKSTLEKIDDREWLQKVSDPLLERGFLFRLFWARFRLCRQAKQSKCNVLFVPGGSDSSGFKPLVTMSQNLLPFEWREMRRFGWSHLTLKFLLLRWSQGSTFQKSDGVIFLTEYARVAVLKVTGKLLAKTVVVPHGIHSRFQSLPRPQRTFLDFTNEHPCRVLYVSIVDVYKHQWRVAEAVAYLRSEGLQVVLELVGPPASGITRLLKTINRLDPSGAFITYRGGIPYEMLDAVYAGADIGVFASSCENMPNILLEGMAAGLPIACSNMGPMPEVLGEAGVYFDPEDSISIASALRNLMMSSDLRHQIAHAAFDRAQAYTWKRCANETFGFLANICNNINVKS